MRRAPAALILLAALLLALPTSAAAATRVYLPLGGDAAIGAPVPTATPSATPRPTATTSPTPAATATPSATATATSVPPTATTTATATPDPRADAVFVFVQGLRTSSSSRDFDDYKWALAARGYSYSQFVDYSYIGTPGYQCSDTLQPFGMSYGYLLGLLTTIAAQKPTARIVVVGHSLGGLLAINALADGAPNIVGVETIDAPLQGVGSGKLTIGDAGGCLFSDRAASYAYPIYDYLDGLHTNDAAYAAYWTSIGRSAASRGALLRTIGNTNDCLYYPPLCGAIGFYSVDTSSQVLPAFGTWLTTSILSAWLNPLFPLTGISQTHSGLLKSANGYLPYLTDFADRAARSR